MNEVKQYDAFDGYGSAMPGKFVRHDDYAALEAECERLRSLLDELHPYVRGCPIDLWDRYHPALIGKKSPF